MPGLFATPELNLQPDDVPAWFEIIVLAVSEFCGRYM